MASAQSGNGSHDLRMARLAATTTSLRALKPYLDGQRAFRAGNVTAAEEAFQRTVAVDSAFALGWYWLAVAAQWMLDPATSQRAADNAVRAGHALPERERELLAAFSAYVDGRSDEAEKRYRALTATSPDDVEAWRGLGEVLFHYNWASGRLAAESRPAWERVLRADPGDWGALVHLSQVAARERHWSEVDTLVQRQLGDDSTDLVQLPVRALRAFAVHDTAEENRVIAGLQRTMHLWSLLAAWSVAVDVGDVAGAERLARVPTDSGRRPEVRALAHITLAHLALARGRKAAALAELDSAQAAFPPWGAQYRGFFLALPFVPASREELVSARDALVNVAGATAARQIVTPSPWISVHESVAPQVSHYVAARLSLRLGELDEALRYADDLDRDAGSPSAQALAVDLAREVRAADIAARGQPATALSSASERGPDLPFVYPWTSPFYSRALARFERATLLASLGRHDDALRAYSVFTDNSLDDLIFAAPAHLARARLLERSGDTARAKAEYGAFLALWRGCDPELRGSLGEAEAALTRLGQVR